MINTLKIRNYALIDNLEISFSAGFVTITGETGAGKSILMGALSLILGQRADTTVLLDKEKKCFVEGEFVLTDQFQPFFDENDLDFETSTFIRREILPGGKSRAFINDTPVNLAILKQLGDQLVDIHSQHQSLQLKDHLYQLQVVDIVGQNTEKLHSYSDTYSRYKTAVKELEDLKSALNSISDELDFYQFQHEELERAKLEEVNIEELEDEVNRLENVEEIRYALGKTMENLDADTGILASLRESMGLQDKAREVNKGSVEYFSRLESAYIDLKDLAAELSTAFDRLDSDPEKLQKSKDRLDLIYTLLQKHKVRDIEELIELNNSFREKIRAITFSDESLSKLDQEIVQLKEELNSKASKLHEARLKTATFIDKTIRNQLLQLGIPNANFTTAIEKKEGFDRNGYSDVRFLFTANKNIAPEEISRVASGGEISRVMLSIKSLLSDYKGLPTLIFDEIDTGVSGEIAEKMGAIMKNMAGGRQVIAITHLPQVASQGNEHFLVFKEDEEDATKTRLRKLTKEERIVEIAKLLSGEQVTDAALSNAKELMRNSQ